MALKKHQKPGLIAHDGHLRAVENGCRSRGLGTDSTGYRGRAETRPPHGVDPVQG